MDKGPTRADTKTLLLSKATTLEVRQPKHEKSRDASQLFAVPGQTRSFSLSFDEPCPEEILQFFNLSTILTLPNRIATSGFDDASSNANFQKCFEAIQRKAAFSKKLGEHDWIVM